MQSIGSQIYVQTFLFSGTMDCSFRYPSNSMCAGRLKPVISFEDEQVDYEDDEITSLSDLLRFRGLFFTTDVKDLIICDCHLLEFGQKWRASRLCALKIGCQNGRALPRGKINVRQSRYLVEKEGMAVPIGSGRYIIYKYNIP